MQQVILILLLFFVVNSFAQTDSGWDRYVGRAGDVYISEKEFQQRFEMLPSLYRQRKSQIDISKRELMVSLIAEKLLVQEARSRNLDSDSLYQHAMLEIRKLLARDQLYREEISQKVNVAPHEITAGVQAARKQVLTAFIYFDDEEEARFVRERLKRPSDFDTFILDSSMNALRDTASIVWGEALPAIEQAAYKLRAGEISPVVQAGEGYYILKCVSVTPNSLFSSMPPQSLRERVVGRIRTIKEKERADEFLRTAFTDKVAYSRPQPLRILADAISEVFSKHLQPLDSSAVMTSIAAGLVREKMKSIVNDTLTVVGNTYWSVGSVIERLVLKRFEVSRESLDRMFPRLNIDIGFWAQQELLGQEGVRRGLDRRPEVQRQIEVWEHATLAAMMKEYARRQTHVSDEEVWRYLQHTDSATPIPHVQIRELRTGSIEQMQEALAELQQGTAFADVVKRWSIDEDAKHSGGLSGFFPITERSPIGTIAWRMEPGQRYGPIGVADTVSYFELVAKKAQPELADTSFATRKKRAAGEVAEMKRKRMLTLFLSQSAARRGFDVYEDRLKNVEVTPTPMMTFRLLGFGGRMFEIPFVDPQMEWLEAEPPNETILP